MRDAQAREEIKLLKEKYCNLERQFFNLVESLKYDTRHDSVMFADSITSRGQLNASEVMRSLDQHDTKFEELYKFLDVKRVNYLPSSRLEKKTPGNSTH